MTPSIRRINRCVKLFENNIFSLYTGRKFKIIMHERKKLFIYFCLNFDPLITHDSLATFLHISNAELRELFEQAKSEGVFRKNYVNEIRKIDLLIKFNSK